MYYKELIWFRNEKATTASFIGPDRKRKREFCRLNNDNSAEQKQEFEKELQSLVAFIKQETPYAGMSRFFVKSFLKENNII